VPRAAGGANAAEAFTLMHSLGGILAVGRARAQVVTERLGCRERAGRRGALRALVVAFGRAATRRDDECPRSPATATNRRDNFGFARDFWQSAPGTSPHGC
jgi:hypothetical protein